jgi:CRISPR type IV-associated protein Csf1
MIYTSELAASALKLKPLGKAHEGEPCSCAFCARALKRGDIVSPLDLPKTFTDFPNISASGMLCGYCAATTQSQTIMRALQRVLITREGVYSMGTDPARAWLWLTPPEPPFAVVINHSTLGCFHYFWRTPVTISKELIQVNVDGDILQVHRERVIKAINHANRLVDAANQPGQKKGLIATPFERLDRTATSGPMLNHGTIRKDCLALAKENVDCAASVAYLSGLNMAELFALSSIFKSNPKPPEKPYLIGSLEEAVTLAKDSAAKKAEELRAKNAERTGANESMAAESEPSL